MERPGDADEDGVGRWLVWRTFGGGGGGGKGILTRTGRTAEWALRDWLFLHEVLETFGLASLESKRPLVLHVGLHRNRTWPLLATNATR
jgi:hypothetical protein